MTYNSSYTTLARYVKLAHEMKEKREKLSCYDMVTPSPPENQRYDEGVEEPGNISVP